MSSPDNTPPQSHAPDTVDGHALGSHRLGPHVVGQRVVVRRIVPGETGPSGGPAFTDVLGECLSWARGLCEIRTQDGTVVAVHVADIVSGKPVPPRPSVRLRTPASTVLRHAGAVFGDLRTQDLGQWQLRDGGRAEDGRVTRRGNSVLAEGDPGLPLADALDAVVAHYRALGLPPVAQVVVGSETEDALLGAGWQDDGGQAYAQVAALSQVVRNLPAPPPVAELASTDDRLAVARIGEGARVRIALSDDWAVVSDLWVAPGQRRTGLARAVLAEGLDWAASLGAGTVHLQVEVDNHAALGLYRTLGFTTHHEYHYLVPA